MRAVVQRVTRASVTVGTRVVGAIDHGLLVLLGVSRTDDVAAATWMANKVAGLRIFSDADQNMNLSVTDVGGSVLVVSQFTLYGDASRGRRPSFVDAAPGDVAAPLVDACVAALRELGVPVETGEFGSMMNVELVNDGPVTILLESS